MTREQLMGALLFIQGSPGNFDKLLKTVGYEPPQKTVTDSANELYSDRLLEYIFEHARMLPVVNFDSVWFEFAAFFGGWDGTMRYIHCRPCTLIGQSKPTDFRSTRDSAYESVIQTYVDIDGYVFNVELRSYEFTINGVAYNLSLRQPCGDERLRLNFVDEFFPETYSGFWD